MDTRFLSAIVQGHFFFPFSYIFFFWGITYVQCNSPFVYNSMKFWQIITVKTQSTSVTPSGFVASHTLLRAPSNYWFHSPRVTEKEPHYVFGSGFSCSTECLWDSALLLCGSLFLPFDFWVTFHCTTLCNFLSVHQLKDMQVVPSPRRLWMKPL